VRYAFEEVSMERVIAGADAPKAASLRVIEKLGMKYLGNINPAPRKNLTLRCPGRISLRQRVDVGVGCGWSSSPSDTPPASPMRRGGT
jgi:hypothetical protein